MEAHAECPTTPSSSSVSSASRNLDGRFLVIRVDVYVFVNAKGEFLRSFDSVLGAVEWATPMSRIPGNTIGLVIYAGDKPVDVMVF